MDSAAEWVFSSFTISVLDVQCYNVLHFKAQPVRWHINTHPHTDTHTAFKKSKLGVTVCMRVKDQATTGTSDASQNWQTHSHTHRMMMCGTWPFRLTPTKEKICPTAAAHITLQRLAWMWCGGLDLTAYSSFPFCTFHRSWLILPRIVKMKHLYRKVQLFWKVFSLALYSHVFTCNFYNQLFVTYHVKILSICWFLLL